MDEQRSVRQRALARVIGADVAEPAGDHDRLVIAAHLAVDFLLERAKVPEEIGPPELVVERRAADRSLQHDVERGGDPLGLAEALLPRLRQSG